MLLFRDFSDADRCRILAFTAEKEVNGKHLMNHVIRIVEVEAEDFCETMCYMEPDCVSINLDKRVGRNGHYECELNNVTHERHERELETEENYFYHAAKVSNILCNEYGFSKAITISITFIFHSINFFRFAISFKMRDNLKITQWLNRQN